MRYLILFLLLSFSSKAQVVSYVKYKHEADLVVYEVDYKWQADLTYVETMNRFEAKQGIWYVSDRKEGVKLYKAKYKHEADLLIFRVGYRHDIKGKLN
jgi:hypothetical protein